MDLLFEQKLTNNTALASHLISMAIRECFESKERKSGVELPLVFTILPLVFHKATAESLANKKRPGALIKALSENREIPLGLQERMEGFADLTLAALNLSFAANLLYLDVNGTMEIVPGKESKMDFTHPQIKTSINAAKRVGQSLSELNVEQLCIYLNIRF
ncbi:MAG: hypothetical protein IIA61_13790 [Candidatus Marinimicrobia bacterium]|nr:hypothetical protein [Candidatus Neomarinimicrobiota bacterium]